MTGDNRFTEVTLDTAFSRIGQICTSRSLRIVAYHGVSDPERLADHFEYFRTAMSPVSGSQVADAMSGRIELPPRAIWVTFDDGHSSVVAQGMPLLRKFGIPATLFVCPGLIQTREPFWWDVIASAERVELNGSLGLQGALDTKRHLKSIADGERRILVEQVRGLVQSHGEMVPNNVVARDQLEIWCEAGLELGNHTWDHPFLDRCSRAEQREQIARSHEWLADLLGAHPRVFAYPNGDWTSTSEEILANLGYEVGLLFDHHLTSRLDNPLRLSRLRLDSSARLSRARAIVSGVHPALFALDRRLRRWKR